MLRTEGEGVLSKSRRRSWVREDSPTGGAKPSAPVLWTKLGEMVDSGSLLMSECPGEVLK